MDNVFGDVNDLEASQILWNIDRMIMDREIGENIVVMRDGSEFRLDLDPRLFFEGSSIIRTVYDPGDNMLYMHTDRSDVFGMEIPTLSSESPLNDRLIVYLDQKDWSQLSRIYHDEYHPADEPFKESTRQLMDWAKDSKIILPFSFAHLVETSKWSNYDRRYRLAITLASVSRGWQMRYPIKVWESELNRCFADRNDLMLDSSLNVFTLEGGAAQPHDLNNELMVESAGLPLAVAKASKAIVSISSYFEVALSSDSSTVNTIPDWVKMFQLITDEVNKDGIPAHKRRGIVKAMFTKDFTQYIARAAVDSGITMDSFERWYNGRFDSDMRRMKTVGMWYEIFQSKHLNATTRWEDNDLIDMMFLSCAAANADFTVAERSMSGYIQQSAKRLGRTVRISKNFNDLVAQINVCMDKGII